MIHTTTLGDTQILNNSFFFLPPSQELSNTIWAFATSGVRGNTQVQLVQFIADALDDGDGQFFGADFKRTFLLTFCSVLLFHTYILIIFAIFPVHLSSRTYTLHEFLFFDITIFYFSPRT